MINNVTLTGRLTKDPELKYTPSGVGVASLTIAVNRPFANDKGEKETDFIFCVAWRKTGETMANFLKKGSLIGVTGRLQTRSYEDKSGKRQFVTEVVVEQFSFLESKQETKTEQPYHRYGA
jgi:single-strand DNA-binding protein